MPTYEYECQEVGRRFEMFQGMTDELLKTCPGSRGTMQRLLGTGAAVIFKGSGFHAADYRQPQTHCGQERPCCGRDSDVPAEAGAGRANGCARPALRSPTSSEYEVCLRPPASQELVGH